MGKTLSTYDEWFTPANGFHIIAVPAAPHHQRGVVERAVAGAGATDRRRCSRIAPTSPWHGASTSLPGRRRRRSGLSSIRRSSFIAEPPRAAERGELVGVVVAVRQRDGRPVVGAGRGSPDPEREALQREHLVADGLHLDAVRRVAAEVLARPVRAAVVAGPQLLAVAARTGVPAA